MKIGMMIQDALRKAILFMYRVCAIFLLYAVLVGVLAYVCVMGVYAINASWIAPVVLSPADDKSLTLTERLLTTQNTLENLSLDVKRQNDGIAEMKNHRAMLLALEPELEIAIQREAKHNAVTGQALAKLEEQKRADNLRTQALLTQLNEVEANTNKELAAGLITKKDATAQLAYLNQTRNLYTDNEIGVVLLKDSILQKSPTDTKTLDVLDKKAELKSQIAQLDISIALAEKQSETDAAHIERLQSALLAATQNPYYLAMTGGRTANFAFVPYENKGGVSVGVAVYDCYLKVLVCRLVGTVKQIFSGEERATHPIFRTDMRGFLVQLDLVNQESAKSKTLFVSRRPLFF